ncbi:MAG: enoyl-CoA hydratase/isomerase family protein [bacterium]
MSAYRWIEFRRLEFRAELILKNPPKNFLTAELLSEVVEAIEPLKEDENLKVFIIKGFGNQFCGGYDWAELTADRVGIFMPLYTRVFHFLNQIKGITIAAVKGEALGPGTELAIFCDITFAARSARFGFLELRAGIFPPIATAVLPRLSGRNRALDWIFSAKLFTAQEAWEGHMVARVFPDEELDEFVDDYTTRITTLSAPAVVLAKRAVDGALYSPVIEALKTTESTFMIDLMKCLDPQEGIAAAIEGRTPIWKNR